jgi:feruloyl-CoA synthase
MTTTHDSPNLFLPPALRTSRSQNGALILESAHELAECSETVFGWLAHWASVQPGAKFLAEKRGGAWRHITYGEMDEQTAKVARHLLAAGCGPDRPLATIGRNSISHAILLLAAQRAGIPVAPISPSYASRTQDFTRLNQIMGTLPPGLILLPQPELVAAAIPSMRVHGVPVISLDELMALPKVDDTTLAAAEATLTKLTVAKILFTSGSTSTPKGVINTNEMLCSNQDALRTIWPFVQQEKPVLVDWLPWNHTFGGNFCFNFALRNGGTLYIDAGSPLPADIATTAQNLREIAPTVYFNVPSGFDALLSHFENDEKLGQKFFSQLRFMFSASAALPQRVLERLETLSERIAGRRIQVLGAWGSTETAPACTAVHFAASVAANIGLPLPGTTIKLAPVQDRLELRVRGPNVTPGYWREPELTAAAFDEEKFFRMGDAGKLIDPQKPDLGILFDGRLAENFKLISGTWVDVNRLRLAALQACHPLIRDIVICGHDTDQIGVMIFLNTTACRKFLNNNEITDTDLAENSEIRTKIAAGLAAHNQGQGSSRYISRFIILTEPPKPETGEITDKNYLNQRAVITGRPSEVKRLFAEGQGASPPGPPPGRRPGPAEAERPQTPIILQEVT